MFLSLGAQSTRAEGALGLPTQQDLSRAPATHKNLSTDPKMSIFPLSSQRNLDNIMSERLRDQSRAEHNVCLLAHSVESFTFQTQPPDSPSSHHQARSCVRNVSGKALLIYTLFLVDKNLRSQPVTAPPAPRCRPGPCSSTTTLSSPGPWVLLHSRDVGVSSCLY